MHIAKYITIIKNQWKERFMWFDSGDQFQGSLESKITNGDIITDFFNIKKLNASTIGNHEFDFGQTFLKERLNKSNADTIVANIHNNSNHYEFLPKQVTTKIYQIGDIKIGVIGIATVKTKQTTKGNLTNINFVEYKPVIEKHSKILRPKCNAVILLAHIGVKCDYKNGALDLKIRTSKDIQGDCNDVDEAKILAKELKEDTVDLILAGHKHSVTHHWINKIPIVSSDRNGEYSNVVYLSFNKSNNYSLIKDQIKIEGPLPTCNQVFSKTKRCETIKVYDKDKLGELTNYSFHNVSIEVDEEAKIVSDRYYEQFINASSKIITEISGTFTRSKDKENALCNLFSDIIKEKAGTDFVIFNVGSLRTSWNTGKLTKGLLYAMSPFDNFIVKFKLRGKDIKRMLRETMGGSFGFYATAGFKLVVKIHSTGKKSFISGKAYDGLKSYPLDDDKLYSIASLDFCIPLEPGVSGGDDFASILKWMKPINVTNVGSLRDTVETYLSYLSVLRDTDYYDENNLRMRVITS